ncbi:YdeI/OmpD-associated family protein [Desertivirga arenae]|uniref:YdeI/OmpD-associated family protein n=1 Tax=Desertivirga arenae TaxID=2810309 RepID=UPI001A97444B|nr:YdeI/OmpD-associated family protein [Pedobacter sp. SYSU D00823]
MEFKFSATIEVIGINPFVFVPDTILQSIFERSGKSKGAIPVKGSINGKPYTQTLVKYSGSWRLYINLLMLANSTSRIGETIEVFIEFDPADRTIPIHPRLLEALEQNIKAKAVFESVSPSLRKEIVRYIARLKSEESIERNVIKAINFLLGKGRFIGRNNP